MKIIKPESRKDLKNRVVKLERSLSFLSASASALLEDPEIECRGDEDCDHCVLVSAIDSADELLKNAAMGAGKP